MTMPSLSTRLRKDSEKKGAQGLIVCRPIIAWRVRERELLTPGSSQRLDLFKKVLCVLCPNLPDAFIMLEEGH